MLKDQYQLADLMSASYNYSSTGFFVLKHCVKHYYPIRQSMTDSIHMWPIYKELSLASKN